MPKDIFDAIRERRERATEVQATYSVEHAGGLVWVVAHPVEGEERTYVVDLAARTCTCPDFGTYCKGREIDCKHIAACLPLGEQITGLPFERREVLSPDSIAYVVHRVGGRDVIEDVSDPEELKMRLGWVPEPDPDDPFSY